MADDIVTRLRGHARKPGHSCLACDAADEIERLRSLVEDLRADRDHWCRMATAT